jgi:phosphoenolpyruvate carboxykinase (GTP)
MIVAAYGIRSVDAIVLSSPALATRLNGFERLLLAVLPTIAPNLAVANGLDANNMSDYFQHWLNVGEKLATAGVRQPKIYNSNWFRKGEDGKFIWPGYGENMRVLKWIIDRIEGQAGGEDTPFGVTPSYADLNWDGLEFGSDKFDQVNSFDKGLWTDELKLHQKHFDMLHYHLPKELVEVKAKIEARLAG